MPRPVPGRGGRRNGQTCGEILPAHIYHNEEKQRCQFLLGSDLFRLVDPPLQPGLVEPYPVRGVWFPSHFRLEGTSHIHNFGLSPVAHGTQGTRPRQYPPPSAFCRASSRRQSLDGRQNRYSYVTTGASTGFSGKIIGLKPPWSQLGIPRWCPSCSS
jgi:hypothetical protein